MERSNTSIIMTRLGVPTLVRVVRRRVYKNVDKVYKVSKPIDKLSKDVDKLSKNVNMSISVASDH